MPPKKDYGRIAFNKRVEHSEVGLRFLEKKKETVGHIFIRAYDSLGVTLAEVNKHWCFNLIDCQKAKQFSEKATEVDEKDKQEGSPKVAIASGNSTHTNWNSLFQKE